MAAQNTEIVLTAHPTQVNRRTIQYKFTRIASFLAALERKAAGPEDREGVLEELVRPSGGGWALSVRPHGVRLSVRVRGRLLAESGAESCGRCARS